MFVHHLKSLERPKICNCNLESKTTRTRELGRDILARDEDADKHCSDEVGVQYESRIAAMRGREFFLESGPTWVLTSYFNGRCGIALDTGMENVWGRGSEKRHDSPMAVLWLSRVLSLTSVYGPVSGVGF